MKLEKQQLPFVSVIIPTYHDWDRLRLALDALSKQNYDPARFEIIIVNNDPDDTPPPDFLLLGNAVLIDESNSGSYVARNKGISLARGTILAFTDADCRPTLNWVKRVTENISGGVVVAGHIELQIQEPENYWELLDKAAHMRNDQSEAKQSIATANMAVYKSDFLKVGFFDEVTSGGDFQWSKAASSAGLRIKYCKDVVVYHPTRKTYEEISKKMVRISEGYAELCRRNSVDTIKGLAFTLAKVPLLPTGVKIQRRDLKSYLHFRLRFVVIRLKQLAAYLTHLRSS